MTDTAKLHSIAQHLSIAFPPLQQVRAGPVAHKQRRSEILKNIVASVNCQVPCLAFLFKVCLYLSLDLSTTFWSGLAD